MPKAICVALLLLALCAPAPVRAQGRSALFERIEKSMREKAPKWTLKRNNPVADDQQDFNFASFLWEDDGETRVDVFVVENKTDDDAKGWFHMLSLKHGVPGIATHVMPGKVSGLGEDNFRWDDPYFPSTVGVTFIRGKVVVRVGSSSKAAAEWFASLIDHDLPRNP